jgi:hypothetical protein
VSVYVSVFNLASSVTSGTSTITLQVPTVVGNASVTPSIAQLVTSETAPELAFVTGTTGTPSNSLIAVPISGGTGSAVWEVANVNPNAIDTLQFAVYVSYTASPGTNSPAPGSGNVALSYAPIPTQGAFTAAAGAAASSTLPIPRFQDTSTTANFLTVTICQTALLWPFVSAQAGFDTGIAIANTSQDPAIPGFGTTPQTGTCTLYMYGSFATGATPVATYNVPSIPGGTVYATNMQSIANGFQGYVIGICNFQYAHGYAAISDTGVRNYLSSYLALVMANQALLNRGFQSETFTH